MAKSSKEDSSKLWEIVNSAFFLWFLSTIIIGTGTFLLKKWDNEKAVFLLNQENIKRLDLEISSRLQYFYEQILSREPGKNAILIDEAIDIIAITFASFNLKRWGYPFKGFKVKTEVKNVEIDRAK